MSMRITRLKIDSYGLFRDEDWDLDPGMNLFFGRNESGKTLLAESMIKMLLGGDTGNFHGIDRVPGSPKGFLEVERNRETVHIPEADYTDLFPDGTTSADIRNAFVIRDIDLRRPTREPDFGRSEYLKDVTDRVMGAQTRKIESVRAQIADLGNLANKDSTRLMNQKPDKLKDRRSEAESLSKDLTTYLEECREEGVLSKVRKKRVAESDLKSVRQDITELEKAEIQADFNDGLTLIEELRGVEKEIQDHLDREDEIDEYRDLRRQIDSLRDEQAEQDINLKTYRRAGYLVAVLFALSLTATIVSPLPGLQFIAGALFIALVAIGYRYYQDMSVVGERKQLVEEARYEGFEGDELPEMYTEIDNEIDDYEDEGSELSDKRSQALGGLKTIFEADHDSLGAWEEELQEFADEVEEIEIEYDENKLEELKEKRRELESKVDGLQSDLEEHRSTLSGFESDIRSISPENYLDDIDEVRIQSVEDLREGIRILDLFVSYLDERKETALAAIKIFKDLEEEEEQEINELFTEDDFVSSTFGRITDGNYTDIWYDETEDSIQIERVDGEILTPIDLSQGTYDLLYLTIRLKLADKLLDGGTGFLLLDDAFIHSDANRTDEELLVLNELVQDGWQIIYFSFREAVRDSISKLDGTTLELEPFVFGE